MADQPGFLIEGHLFPFVTSYKHGDPILIHEVTGLTWDEFSDLLAEAGEDGARPNPIVQTALIAVAIQHAQPGWSRKRVSDYIRNISLGSEEVVGVETDEPAEGDIDASEEVAAAAVPPAESAASSDTSDEKSSTPEGSSSENSATPNPTFSADPGSSTTTPDLRQVV